MAIRELLRSLDLIRLSADLREQLSAKVKRVGTGSSKVRRLTERVKVVESLRDSGNRPEWLVLDCVSVLPPARRRGANRRADGDLDQFYIRIINRNQRLRKLTGLNAPEVILRNERRMLQQAVDALFDNGRCRRPVCDHADRRIRSLTYRLQVGPGRLRGPLAGKRVDYSARSVAVPGPELELHQCGLPLEMALELYRPFVLGWLIDNGSAEVRERARELAYEFRPDAEPPPNWPSASGRLKELGTVVWTALVEVVKGRLVLLSRSPVIDRARLQAFEPVLTEGKAVRVHPLVCGSMGLDFDGDQVAVYLPLSIEAQVEASVLMTPVTNLFSPANGNPIVAPSRDIVLGCYYLTANRGAENEAVDAGDGMAFHSPAELFHAHAEGKLGLHAHIQVRLPIEKKLISEVKNEKGTPRAEEVRRKPNGRVRTTVGRVIFNDILHPQMAFYDLPLGSKYLGRVIADCYQLLGGRETVELLDRIKTLGFRETTRSGLSLATSDLITPEGKATVLLESDKQVQRWNRYEERGLIGPTERYNKVIDTWIDARDQVSKRLILGLQNERRPDPVSGKMVPYLNPLWLMAQSGASCGVEQIRKLAGMHGLVASPSGIIQELPIKGNYREGFTALEYWTFVPTVRIAMRNELLKPFDTTDLTRRLIDLTGDVVVTMHDCGTQEGVTKGISYKGDAIDRSLAEALRGRVARRTLTSAYDGSVVVLENGLITDDVARRIERLGIDKFQVRSPMTCRAPSGVCRMCYGADPTTGRLVEEGTAVGLLAAQSLCAPAADLVLRKFRYGSGGPRATYESDSKTRRGGVVRFENLRVATNDAGERVAMVSGYGAVEILRNQRDPRASETHPVPHGGVLLVSDGEEVASGTLLCRWDPNHAQVLSEAAGRVEFRQMVEGQTVRVSSDPSRGGWQLRITEHRGDLNPHIVIRNITGRVAVCYYLHENTLLDVHDGQEVTVGTVLARTPLEYRRGRNFDTGGFPRLREVLEARRPRWVTVLARVSGIVQLGAVEHGARVIHVQPTDGAGAPVGGPVEHRVPRGQQLLVSTGERVEQGAPLVPGDPAPQDILQILGLDAVRNHLLDEIVRIYRAQRMDLDDRHIEVIIARMLRTVRVDSPGNTDLLPGTSVDVSEVQRANARLGDQVRIEDAGDSEFAVGAVVGRRDFEQTAARLEAVRQRPPTAGPPVRASMTPELMGITDAAAQPESFLAPGPSRDIARVLAGAALGGQVDSMAGFKQNAILGSLVPAGTGWPGHRGAEIRGALPPVAPPKKTADGLFPHDRLRPAHVRARLAQVIALGHSREHLSIGPDGTVTTDGAE